MCLYCTILINKLTIMNKLESVEGVINAMLLLETAYGDMPEELDGVFGKLMVLRDAEDLDE